MYNESSDGSIEGVGVGLLIDLIESFDLIFIGLGLLVIGFLLFFDFWLTD